ncbi:hypothetical protein B566_EDAN007480, partial [Ephemera danica]
YIARKKSHYKKLNGYHTSVQWQLFNFVRPFLWLSQLMSFTATSETCVPVRLRVLLFATARELSGCSEGELLTNATETYHSLLSKVVHKFALAKIRNSIILALNEEYPEANTQLTLKDGDLVAVIPPLSGVKLSHERLSVDEATRLATAPSCGAVSIFVGTTRDNFESKKVVQLEYEAYDSMAEKVMKELCMDIRSKLGVVPVCEASEAPVAAQEVEILNPVREQQAQKSESLSSSSSSSLVQIKATPEEVRRRIECFISRKRQDVNRINIRDFCTRSLDSLGQQEEGEEEVVESCARIDAVLVPRKDSKSHLRVRRVLNTWGPQTTGIDPGSMPTTTCRRNDIDTKPNLPGLPPGVAERLSNVEDHLGINKAVPSNIYKRLKMIEDRILYLESISPEYFSSSIEEVDAKTLLDPKNHPRKKKKYSSADLLKKLEELEQPEYS